MQENITEKIWLVVKPILQKEKTTGRPEFDIKKTFFGILYVLENSIKWRCLPTEYGKPSTVHGKFMKWIYEGRIQKVFHIIRGEYISLSEAFNNWYAIDTSSIKAPYANFSGKNPTDRGKRGIKKNIIVDSRGAPLVVNVASAQIHDSKTFTSVLKLLEKIKRTAFSIIAADSAYDSKNLKIKAMEKGFILHTSTNKRRNKLKRIVKPLGRWIVEPCHSWLNNFRSIKICYTKNAETFLAFLQLAAAIQLFRMI